MENPIAVSEKIAQRSDVVPAFAETSPPTLYEKTKRIKSATSEIVDKTALITESGGIFLSVNL